jgi:arylsulfatase
MGSPLSNTSPEKRTIVYEGTTRAIPEVLAAPVPGHSHTITAHVRVSEDAEPDGVLATCGGRFGGYALYVSHGRLTYVQNYVGDARYVVEAKTPIYPGERELRLAFEKTGEETAHVRLFVDGVLDGEGDVAHTVPRVFSTSEPCEIGSDSGTAAGDYAVPSPFTGRVHDVTISVDAS